jgi:hypothetical protein
MGRHTYVNIMLTRFQVIDGDKLYLWLNIAIFYNSLIRFLQFNLAKYVHNCLS